jgi:hypothetical protein
MVSSKAHLMCNEGRPTPEVLKKIKQMKIISLQPAPGLRASAYSTLALDITGDVGLQSLWLSGYGSFS